MKLPVLSGRDVIKSLKKIYFEEKRQKGSHIILIKETEEGKKAVVVPNHITFLFLMKINIFYDRENKEKTIK